MNVLPGLFRNTLHILCNGLLICDSPTYSPKAVEITGKFYRTLNDPQLLPPATTASAQAKTTVGAEQQPRFLNVDQRKKASP